MNRPEILAPAGNRRMADAAMAAGADAIYIAADQFGARAFADNFTEEEIQQLLADAHRRGVRIYLAVNTLLHENEREEAARLLQRLSAYGLDAAIIQDLGLNQRLEELVPTLARHASTQLSITSLAGAREIARLGFSRLVIGRETSIDEVERILRDVPIEVEVFIHGSLCVSVSGQCLLSAFQGGRSGNRGACAQPCRKEYTLERPDGTLIGPTDAYLSPKDLMVGEGVRRLAEIGVRSLKIEGRMKKPEYTFQAVRAYKAQLDGEAPAWEDLRLMTNRPLSRGFLFGAYGTEIAAAAGGVAGLVVGTIAHQKGRAYVSLNRPLSVGDILELRGKRGIFPFTLTKEMSAGDHLYFVAKDLRDGDPVVQVFTERVRCLLDAAQKEALDQGIQFTVTLLCGAPMQVVAEAGGVRISIEGDVLASAENRALDEETIRRAFQKLGGTGYYLEKLTIEGTDAVFLPVSRLNALRRAAVEALTLERTKKPLDAPVAHSSITVREGLLANGASGVRPGASPVKRRAELVLETDRPPAAFGDAQSLVSVVRLKNLRHAKAWKASCARVEWDLPLLQDQSTWPARRAAAKEAGDPFDGFYARTLNEIGWVRDEEKEIALGPGMNLLNGVAVEALQALEIPFVSVCASLEAESTDLRGFPSEAALEIVVEGPAPGMIMRHCPASLYRGCTDESGCATCPYQSNIVLRDAFGSRLFRRRHGYTELEAPTRINRRKEAETLLQLAPQRLTIINDAKAEEALRWWDRFLG